MKQDSLVSQLSDLSHISNLSYHGEKKQYAGSQFFKQSLGPGQALSAADNEFKQQEIQLGSLNIMNCKVLPSRNQSIEVFTPFWTSDLHHNIEGISDNSNENTPQPKKQDTLKIKDKVQKLSEIADSSVEKVSEEQIEQKISKNETKNIPKNYGKAIIIFIQKNRELLTKVLKQNGDNYDRLLGKLRNLKKRINTISDLRNLWQQQTESKSLRIISNIFLRKYALQYIYNSRIKTRLCHAKYKRRLQEAIINPKDFNHIKDY